jgi:superfamily II RNA helicase
MPNPPASPDELFDAFENWAAGRGLELYPAQAEAEIAITAGDHVILATPTGSGKSLVAVGAHMAALATGQRSFYTAPIKALVSEKFFDLVDIFGADQVGMMTGDIAINPDAPIVACTAEILASMALRHGDATGIGQVVMDEFHFYSEPDRGWAWQVPLLTMTSAQFILMSATLGDVSFFVEDLRRRTGRPVTSIGSVARPVPLTYAYSLTPLGELLRELTATGRAPVYVVHFTQAQAIQTAQDLLSTAIVSREHKERIQRALGDFRFGPGFGGTLSKLLRHGVGVHHAGLLPKYRRLVERLTQAGLLPVVCGTDTLGVGINVPIRTVLLTALVKYDGRTNRHLTAREFHQIAGRAGRAGYDTVGDVIVQAPTHVIDNARALARAGDDERKRRKIVRKQAPSGQVNWTDKTFERLRDADPEPLTSQFKVTTAMVLQLLARGGDPVPTAYRLLTDNHDPPRPRNPHLRTAARIYRSLADGGIVSHVGAHAPPPRIALTVDLPPDFALNQPLAPFALAALEMLDPAAPDYALDAVSVFEATLDDPRPVLIAQEKAAKSAAVAQMKADGVEYNERMARLDEITHPQPLATELTAAYRVYQRTHPWIADYPLSPKSVVRDMRETAMTFNEFISRYDLARSEGVVLRYLTDAYRTLRDSVPPTASTDALDEITEWLGDTVRGVDSSLLEEWERLAGQDRAPDAAPDHPRLDSPPTAR